jgi:hypothetical protein
MTINSVFMINPFLSDVRWEEFNITSLDEGSGVSPLELGQFT